jgi:hypothetical protein
MADNLLTRIRKIRANAAFGKKKHYNAASRKQAYQTWLGTTTLCINVVLGSSFLVLLKSDVSICMKWIGAGLSALAALLTAFQTYFGFQKAIQGHRHVAGRYLELVHQSSNAIAAYADGLLNENQLAKRLEELTKTISRIDADAHPYPTNGTDYSKAREGIARGEEDYSEEEMNAGDG